MRVDYDPIEDTLNIAGHGLSLSLAKKLAWDEALVWVDGRFDYDEFCA